MKRLLFTLFFFAAASVQADVAHGVLEKYPNRVFVGTGMRNYVTIARAINAGFKEILSLEEDLLLVEHKKYLVPKDKNFHNYHAHQGNPGTDLYKLITPIQEQMTIFLSSYLPCPDSMSQKNTILEELDQIAKHNIHTHTILIEYIQHASTSFFGNVTLDSIKSKLLKINPSYQFKLEKGGHLEKEENAVLVAHIPAPHSG